MMRMLATIDDRCDRSLDPVPAGQRCVFQMIAAVVGYLYERGLSSEGANLENMLENDLLPLRLIPKRGTPEYRALRAVTRKKVAA